MPSPVKRRRCEKWIRASDVLRRPTVISYIGVVRTVVKLNVRNRKLLIRRFFFFFLLHAFFYFVIQCAKFPFLVHIRYARYYYAVGRVASALHRNPGVICRRLSTDIVSARVRSLITFVVIFEDRDRADCRCATTNAMAEINVDVARLPEDVREKLAELELELSEGKYSFSVFRRCQYRFFSPSHPQVPTMAPRPPSPASV